MLTLMLLAVLKRVLRFGLPFGVLLWSASAGAVPVKVRDVTDLQGARENQLIGYGLVVGLPGTGDTVIGGRGGTVFTVSGPISSST